MVGNASRVIAILATVLCAATLDKIPITRVVHSSWKMSWRDARDYCEKHHGDVFTFKDESEAKGLRGWVHSSEGSTSEIKKCSVLSDSGSISLDYCISSHHVLCVDERLILVKQNKTWEEALHHCRTLLVEDNTKSYTLAGLPEHSDFWLDQTIGAEEVWVGLRFLAGKWFWVSGKDVTSSNLPVCPAHLQNCGTFSSTDIHWKTIDCNEQRFFLCDEV